MTDFLLELRCEEIPARMQAGARRDLEKLFVDRIGEAGLAAQAITVYSTPRRLALIAQGLPDHTQAVSEEAKGPPEGAPDAAIDGFCRKNGVTREQLELREVKGRATWFAVIDKPGRATGDVLAEAVPAIVRAFPWPKSMRWGDASLSTESLRWVRPLSGIVAILGDTLVPFEIDGIASGYETLGHRFHNANSAPLSSEVETQKEPGTITIGGADDYIEKLNACHVIVDHEERANIIREGAAKAAADAGFALVADEGLVIENAGLTEWPVPLLGHFDPAFLDVPPEVIQLTARVNQKYFVCQDAKGKLAPAFVCTANIAAHDGGRAIVAGNEKVLAARLSDAKFFWELDQKKTLEEHAEKLKAIVFHEKLGTVADKVERVARLARWLVEEGIVSGTLSLEGEGRVRVSDADLSRAAASAEPPHPNPLPAGERELLADMAEQAARLCKADLVTEMVGEFPELQGLMGGYYATAEGLPDAVADAIRDHYKPVGQGDEVPTAPVTVAVSLADKLDSLFQFFLIDEKPTGSKDPFALRRSALAVAALVLKNGLRLPLCYVFDFCGDIEYEQFKGLAEAAWIAKCGKSRADLAVAGFEPTDDEMARGMLLGWPLGLARDTIVEFLIDRLKVQQREAGVRHDLIDAVFALGGEDDLVRLLARVHALQAFVETEDGKNLLAGYKRAANILKKEGIETAPDYGADDLGLSYTPETAEKDLIEALAAAEPRAIAAVEAEDFEGAMAALAGLRAPIDAFFETVTVNDPDEDKRAARLALLARFRAAVHRVADFSRIEG